LKAGRVLLPHRNVVMDDNGGSKGCGAKTEQ